MDTSKKFSLQTHLYLLSLNFLSEFLRVSLLDCGFSCKFIFFQNVVKKVQTRYKIVSPTKYYRKHLGISRTYFHITCILCNFALSNLS